MIDVRVLRQDTEKIKEALAARGSDVDIDRILAIDTKRRELIQQWEELQHKRKTLSQEIGKRMKQGEDASGIKEEVRQIGDEIKMIEQNRGGIELEFESAILEIPNPTDESVPFGKDESQNPEIARWGEPPSFDFEPKAHWDLGEGLGILDFQRGVKVARSRFTLLKGAGAGLERALISFMLDLHTKEHGYKELMPPFLVNTASLVGTGQLPKFKEDLFKVDGWDLFLAPTAEVPVTNVHRDEILEEAELPLYYTAYTPCFRSEAGSYGKDVRGLIRQHQFNKVELVKFVQPETSWDEHEKLLKNAEEVLRRLGLHYRVINLCTGDIGFASAKTYDIEVWLVGEGIFKEISSCSNFTDFQARRANIRYKPKGKKGTEFVHTLNGSGLAVGRTMLAIMEHYQREDGSVSVPEVLRPYMGGLEVIEKEG